MVRLSFGGGSFTEPTNVNTSVLAQLETVAEREGVSARYATAPERFAHLLGTLHTHAGQRVAVLVDEYDKPILDVLDREQVREWYNGYSWRGADKVYNPYDVLLLLRRHEFEAHWFETGTPAFLEAA